MLIMHATLAIRFINYTKGQDSAKKKQAVRNERVSYLHSEIYYHIPVHDRVSMLEKSSLWHPLTHLLNI